MKVYINRKPVVGPWGGGNKTVTKLAEKLEDHGVDVVYTLQPDIGLIFCFNPRPNDLGEWYGDFLKYREAHGAKIIQRVGDLGTHSKPHLTRLVQQSTPMSDFVIFPSDWAKAWLQFEKNNSKIIYNRPLALFHEKKKNLSIDKKIKIITHHWSTNEKKGFDAYKIFDRHIKQDPRYEFVYVGRLPDGLTFQNSTHIQPVSSDILASMLPENHIYLTASIEEAGANHVLEAMASGLPVVYDRSGGSIVDYCKDYGEGYDSFEEMIKKIDKVLDKYKLYKDKVMSYNDTIDETIDSYIDIILSMFQKERE